MPTQRTPEEATSISLLQASTLQEMELKNTTAGDLAAFGEPPVSSNMENAGKCDYGDVP